MITLRDVVSSVKHIALVHGNRAVTNYCNELRDDERINLLGSYKSDIINLRFRRLFNMVYEAIGEIIIDNYYGI